MKRSIASSVPHYLEPCPGLTCISINLSPFVAASRAAKTALRRSRSRAARLGESVSSLAIRTRMALVARVREDIRIRRLRLWMVCNSSQVDAVVYSRSKAARASTRPPVTLFSEANASLTTDGMFSCNPRGRYQQEHVTMDDFAPKWRSEILLYVPHRLQT